MVMRKQQQANPNRWLLYIGTFAFAIAFIVLGRMIAMQGYPQWQETGDTPALRAHVLSVDEVRPVDNGNLYLFSARLLNGEEKGSVIQGYQGVYTNYYPIQTPLSVGDRILVYANPDSEVASWVMQDYLRFSYVLVLGGLFCLGVLLFGRFKGLNTLISLLFTCLAVFSVYIPSILSGKSIYLWTVVICTYIIIMTMLFINGTDKKSFCAGLGCFCGVAVAGLVAFVMNHVMKLTGMANEDTLYLTMLPLDQPIDLNAIIFGTITIGALGAVMDVAMDISSSLNEIYVQNPQLGRLGLIRSGFNIGRDIMGTMANTLVLAYIGCDLATTLLLCAYNVSPIELVNMELIINEFLNALAGSFGILMTIPLTSFICSLVYPQKEKPAPPLYY